MDDAETVCIFMHIPKCAGTSIRRAIAEKNPQDIFMANNHGTVPYTTSEKYIQLFQSVQDEAFNKKIIAGHLCFGIHELTKKKCYYTTIIRDPVHRLWSQYCYMRQLGQHNNPCRGCRAVADSEMDFDAFVSLRGPLPLGNFGCIPNLQTLMIAGRHSSDMLQQAKTNIKQFFRLVGCQKRLEDFREKLAKLLNIPVPRKWLLKKRHKLPHLSAELIAKIERRDSLDMELYDYIDHFGQWREEISVARN